MIQVGLTRSYLVKPTLTSFLSEVDIENHFFFNISKTRQDRTGETKILSLIYVKSKVNCCKG